MAVTDWADYLAKTASPYQGYNASKNAITTVAGRMYSAWQTAPFAGAVPTTAAVPTMTTAGSGDLLQRFNPTANLYVAQATIGANGANAGVWILCDRLSHQGGLSGTTTGAQTTNLPTAALTRYTSGEGVMAALEIYTIVGTTGTTFTISYTNTVPTAGRTSLSQIFGGTGFREASRFIPVDLAAGDTGVTAVASVTLAASTLTAGAFGVTLFKPLAMFPSFERMGVDWDAMLGGCGNLAEIQDNACLFWVYVGSGTTSGILSGKLDFIEA